MDRKKKDEYKNYSVDQLYDEIMQLDEEYEDTINKYDVYTEEYINLIRAIKYKNDLYFNEKYKNYSLEQLEFKLKEIVNNLENELTKLKELESKEGTKTDNYLEKSNLVSKLEDELNYLNNLINIRKKELNK